MSDQLPPGPDGHFLLGNMREINHDTLGFLKEAGDTYGDVVSFRFGPIRLYFVNHPDLVHDVLVTRAKSFYKSRLTKKALEDIIGDNVFTGDGDFWKRERRLMQPAFHSRRIGAYADVMVDYAHRMLDSWQDGDTLVVDEEMAAVTMNIVVKTLFDADIDEETRELGEAMVTLFRVVDNRLRSIFTLPHWVPTASNRTVSRVREQLHTTIGRIIEERRQTGEDRGDLLSMLLMAQDEENGSGLSDRQVLNESITIFGAGHETTAVTLTWTLYLLSQYPEIAAKLHYEVDTALQGRRATLEDLTAMPYTEQIIKESMRLYPPAWGTTRQAIEDVKMGDYTIPKGKIVFVAPWTLHRDARWFDDPETFRPERFSPENEPNIPKYAYIPFGAGPRVCIGNSFAMMEARLVLATIAQHVTLDLVPGQVIEPMRRFTLHPKNVIKMTVKARETVPQPM